LIDSFKAQTINFIKLQIVAVIISTIIFEHGLIVLFVFQTGLFFIGTETGDTHLPTWHYPPKFLHGTRRHQHIFAQRTHFRSKSIVNSSI